DHFTLQTDDDGTAIYRTGIVRDASERKEAEVALKEARDAAEEASRAKSRFLAVMSHELRTPLTGIVGFADLLESGVLGEVSERQTDSLARIKASAWHLVGIIDEILDLSRAEAGNESVRSEETDVAGLAREVAEIVESDAADRGITLHCVDTDAPAITSTDPGKLRQILINLVGNAVKYTDGDRVDVVVDRDDPSCLRVHVRDQGPGIPAAEYERIFEPFTQLDSSHTRPGSGTGLGLAICRRLARLLGGDVTLESEVGSGTTFTLKLPDGG
ncbi:MAG: ATP-binding protein, partial [Ignavibacteriaceae bacterium]